MERYQCRETNKAGAAEPRSIRIAGGDAILTGEEMDTSHGSPVVSSLRIGKCDYWKLYRALSTVVGEARGRQDGEKDGHELCRGYRKRASVDGGKARRKFTRWRILPNPKKGRSQLCPSCPVFDWCT